MDAEGREAFLPGITEGWETLEKMAEAEELSSEVEETDGYLMPRGTS